ncbi:hypothetical protein LEN26_008315 [Aphanomyces euteiches]|nr:hypothetical protein LEN26_008315 [Aphanomyces euteiches]
MALWFVLLVVGVATAVVHLDLIHSSRLEHPVSSYIASIRRRELSGTSCTGVLIAPHFVLTTAQCTVGAKWMSIGSPYRVGGGGDVEHIRVSFSYVHPDHNTTTLAFDLAVLRLEHDSNSTPALLTFEFYAHLTPVLVQGFGRLGFNGAMAETLRDANGTITNNRLCNVNYKLGGIFKDDMMCIVGVQPCAGMQAALRFWYDRNCCGNYGGFVRLSAAQDFLKPFLHGFPNDVCKPGFQRPSLN